MNRNRHFLKKQGLFIGLIGLALFSFLAFTEKASNSTKSETLSYLALGDSYTIGESVAESERWPNQLQNTLKKQNFSIEKPQIIAQTGWRTDDLMRAAQKEQKKFDLVSLLIGVNNEFQGKSVESFESEFKTCLDFAINRCSNGKKGVFVLSIPDYGYTPYGKRRQADISKRIDAFNAVCKNTCDELGVTYFDITPISRKGLDNNELVANDGLHPSGLQYKLWVESCQAAVVKQLEHLN